MFAVPGWSVPSSALKTQTIPAKPVPNNSAPAKDGEEAGASKKRKRNNGKSQLKDVNKENLADMWESVIEGKPKQKKSKGESKKEQKATDVGAEPEALDLAVKVAPKDTNSEQGAKDGKSKKDKKRNKKAKEAPAVADPETNITAASAPSTKSISATPAALPKLTPLQASMRQKLISARFRHLNQTLYTTPSSNSLSLFKDNPEMFSEYHEGFRRQVEVWPENPVDGYIATIQARGKIRGPARGKTSKNISDKTSSHKQESKEDSESGLQPLPRTSGTCTIADLGCGDAALSTSLQLSVHKLHLKIHSFDLHSPSPLVTKADIANLPLPDSSTDIAIFCLALMGTNWIDFIEEAYRILRWKGELWIAEIKSRFGRVGGGGGGARVVEHSVGHRQKKSQPVVSKEGRKAALKKEQDFDDALAAVEVDGHAKAEETDVSAFIEVLRKRGFVLKGDGGVNTNAEGVDLSNRMFVKMAFVKGATPVRGKCVPAPKSGGVEDGAGDGAGGGGTWKKKQKAKFLDDDGGRGREVDETKVLKPCVYKLR